MIRGNDCVACLRAHTDQTKNKVHQEQTMKYDICNGFNQINNKNIVDDVSVIILIKIVYDIVSIICQCHLNGLLKFGHCC